MNKPIITDGSDRYEWIASQMYDLGMYTQSGKVRKMGEELAAAKAELAEAEASIAHLRHCARLQDNAMAAVFEELDAAIDAAKGGA